MGARISAIEYHFPENQLSNDDLKALFPDYDFTSFEEKVGIQKRYIAGKNETGLDLAIKACLKLFERIDKNDIDYVLYCTQSPDHYLPTTACILQYRLKLGIGVGALDFNLGCSGFTYGVSLAKALINAGQAKNVLLVTAETYSKFLHPGDRSNRAIFGDAAAATLIVSDEKEYIHEFLFGTDGSGYDKLIVRNGCARHSFQAEAQQNIYGTGNVYTDNDLYMDGPEIFNFTTTTIPPFVNDILAKNGRDKEAIDYFVFHQANAFMLGLMRKKLKIAPERFHIDLVDGGNTVSSTIPIALKRYSNALSEGPIAKDIVIVGFGVGLSWSGGLIRFENKI